jgi:GNAT superfamily N-acetyltransferase
MTIDVRPATVADAHGIAEVHVRAWQETYAHVVPSDVLARVSIAQRERRWIEILALADYVTFVATEGSDIVGFANAGRGRDADVPRDLELPSIYVLASHYGTGAGQRLLDAALGDRPAFLWVAEDNPRARAFYRRNGFVADGVAKTGPVAGIDVLEVRLLR